MEETGNGEREEEAERRARTDTGKGRERGERKRERERESERALGEEERLERRRRESIHEKGGEEKVRKQRRSAERNRGREAGDERRARPDTILVQESGTGDRCKGAGYEHTERKRKIGKGTRTDTHERLDSVRATFMLTTPIAPAPPLPTLQ